MHIIKIETVIYAIKLARLPHDQELLRSVEQVCGFFVISGLIAAELHQTLLGLFKRRESMGTTRPSIYLPLAWML